VRYLIIIALLFLTSCATQDLTRAEVKAAFAQRDKLLVGVGKAVEELQVLHRAELEKYRAEKLEKK